MESTKNRATKGKWEAKKSSDQTVTTCEGIKIKYQSGNTNREYVKEKLD